jgi:sucrose-phosphate synthase
MRQRNKDRGLYVVLISVHGLLRARRPELGRDADTGGQITYVLEAARALVEHPDVERVDVLTRLIESPDVDDDYGIVEEPVHKGLSIVRIACGPSYKYLRKELLWPYLDSFVDNFVQHLRTKGRAPDLIHGHYADAGYVASQLAGLLDVPMAFTGHSLGRVKRQRLLDQGDSAESIEERYNISRRIEAEETALNHASFVVASTHQEVQEQYERYEYYQRRRMLVIPPGVDLSRFSPPSGKVRTWRRAFDRIVPFLREPKKPMVLAISRADPRKNIGTLIRAYGENPRLQKAANLVLVAGNRDDIGELDEGAREVLTEVLRLIDRYDLYGKVAYPKHHEPDEVPEFYRLAARRKGVFVNPALTEPFGLTLLEAAASGLPVVATDDGGPRDILGHCDNGLLIDPLDSDALGKKLLAALSDRGRWRRWSRNGLAGSRKHFSWDAHAKKYMKAVRTTVTIRDRRRRSFGAKSRLITADRLLVCDVDNTLTGDRKALRELLELLRRHGNDVAFGIATGRSLELAREVLSEWEIPTPQVLITSVGSSIHYGRKMIRDRGWEKHIRYGWRPEPLREVMSQVPGLKLQGPEGQGPFKISFDIDPKKMPPVPRILARLRKAGLRANLVHSHGAYLDVLPIRASKGRALRYFCLHWGIPPERCLVAGDSGNDVEMLTGRTLGVVVGNRDPELDSLRGRPQIYFADGRHAWGIIEGIRHYDFLRSIRVPSDETELHAEHTGS